MAAALPAPLTSLVGREDEVAVALARLRRPDVRLLTLTGPGGIGKTRLAVAVARAAEGAFVDGVRYVSLVATPDASLVETSIVHALGISEGGGRTLRDALTRALSDANLLLVLDNFEHVVDAAPLLTDLLMACPRLTILVTSRTLLRVTGEHALPVPPLSLSSRETRDERRENDHALDSRLSSLVSDAAMLFAERARAVTPSFGLTEDTAPLVEEICQRLDGLPLAIELAAARINHFPLPALQDRLEQRLPLLTGGPRDAPRRLRSMRDAIAWSYDLLSPDEQRLFRRLAVFAGGCTIEGAQAVGDTEETEAADSQPDSAVLAGIAGLIAASVLRHEIDRDGTTRYRMLETIREFAGEQLAAAGEADTMRQQHAAFYLAFAERHATTPFLPDRPFGIDRRDAEHANLRASLTWLEATGQQAAYAQLAGALGWYWLNRGHVTESDVMLERARSYADASPTPTQAKIALARGMSCLTQGQLTAAEEAAAESRALALATNDMLAVAQALIIQGSVALVQGDYPVARQLLEEAREVGLALPDPRQARSIASAAYANLGVVAHAEGQIDLAMTCHEEALAGERAVGDGWNEMHSLNDLGDVARSQGDHRRAASFYREAMAMAWHAGQLRAVFEALEGIACIAVASGQAALAAPWFGAAERARQATGITAMDPVDTAAYERGVDAARAALGEEAFAAAWAAGRALPLAEVVAEALDPEKMAPPEQPPAIVLTPRETEILGLLVAGHTDREIAEALFVSVRTVEDHVARILRKLGVRGRTAAVSAAIAAGLATPTPDSPS